MTRPENTTVVTAEPVPVKPAWLAPSGWSLMILRGLQGRHVYEGTVGDAEKRRRRAVGKRQRAARAMHRAAAKR